MKPRTAVKLHIERAGGDREVATGATECPSLECGPVVLWFIVQRARRADKPEVGEPHAALPCRQVVCDLFVLGSGDFHTQIAYRGRTPPAGAALFHGLKSCQD
jgi:hypothetical protein